MPRNVQKDPEARLAWTIKDDLLRRGRIHYGKLRGNRSTFVSRKLLPYFNAVFGVTRQQEGVVLTEPAQNILRVLRKEWEMATRDLRGASGITDRRSFNKAIEELQRVFKVIPSDVVYEPVFTYIWSLAESRFQDELNMAVSREEALREIARVYLEGAGMTVRGELARVTGVSNPEAGLGNWALVDEGFATRLSPGIYCLTALAGKRDAVRDQGAGQRRHLGPRSALGQPGGAAGEDDEPAGLRGQGQRRPGVRGDQLVDRRAGRAPGDIAGDGGR